MNTEQWNTISTRNSRITKTPVSVLKHKTERLYKTRCEVHGSERNFAGKIPAVLASPGLEWCIECQKNLTKQGI